MAGLYTTAVIRLQSKREPMEVRGAIVDLDGTVYRGGQLLEGADAGVSAMREAGLELLFFSNNPLRSSAEYVDHLGSLGLDVRPGEACSSGVVTRAYLERNHADDGVMVVGADELAAQFRAAGLTVTDRPAETDVLVASWTDEFGYEDMVAALEAVDEDTAFFGTDPDRTVPAGEGRIAPGSGAIVGSIAATVGRDPDAMFGKPSDYALETALDRLDVPAESCLVVGDRLDTDLAMGARAGMTTVLVLSGVSNRTAIADSAVDPEYVIDSLGDIESVLADCR